MGLQVWLPLNGDLRNQGLADITVTNDGATVDNNGKIGKCYSFNNTHIIIDSIQLQNLFSSTTQPFSMACWIYLNTDETDRVIIFGNYSANPFVNWELAANGTQRVCVGGSSNYTTKASTLAVPKTIWTHIAFTYDGTTTKFYQNGIQTNEASGINTLTTKTSSSRFYLGSDTRNNATRLKGRLNDFRLYDHCLSDKEVEEIAKGLILHYKLDDQFCEPTTNLFPSPYLSSYESYNPDWDSALHPNAVSVNSMWNLGYNSGVSNATEGYHAMWNIIDDIPTIVFQNHNSIIGKRNRWMGLRCLAFNFNYPANTQYTISWDQRTLDTLGGYTTGGLYYNKEGTNGFHDGCPKIGQNTKLNTWEKFSYTFTHLINTTTSYFYIYGNNGEESTMQVRNLQLEIKDHRTPFTMYNTSRNDNTIYDSSGYGNDGEITGSLTVVADTARYNYAVDFQSAPTAITVNDSFSHLNTFTYNCWFKKNNNNNAFLVMGYRHGNNTSGSLCAWDAGQGKVGFHYYLYDGGQTDYTIGATKNYNDNQWHMLTATYDGTIITVYLDGQKKEEKSISLLTTSRTFMINYPAGVTTNNRDFIGKLSDCRVYCTVLTEAQIKELYNTSATIDNLGNAYARELVE